MQLLESLPQIWPLVECRIKELMGNGKNFNNHRGIHNIAGRNGNTVLINQTWSPHHQLVDYPSAISAQVGVHR